MIGRLVHFTMDRDPDGRWTFTVGLAWPCGCCYLGAGRTPWQALGRAWRAHTATRGATA